MNARKYAVLEYILDKAQEEHLKFREGSNWEYFRMVKLNKFATIDEAWTTFVTKYAVAE